LKSPDIPSVLIEMGFLTNSQDERYLTTESYRKEIMLRVTRAVLTFLENNEDTSVNIPLAE
jgi:N-acetylmuramoyl-L-alanine amidase